MVEMGVTCVTCEQVLTGGRCTNRMCPSYAPLEDDEHEECQQRNVELEGEVTRLRDFVVERVCFRCSEDFMLDGAVEEDCGELECQEARAALAPNSATER
ncbi:hypothetical protein LCGC14_2239610 [marine sediment metagenome]|uniref:Uncharacterized protein n=1 Tax=marine sediment metagenome TaxID=412755 RepID=A0A0F9G0U6_9ZZZZ